MYTCVSSLLLIHILTIQYNTIYTTLPRHTLPTLHKTLPQTIFSQLFPKTRIPFETEGGWDTPWTTTGVRFSRIPQRAIYCGNGVPGGKIICIFVGE